jgi:hypothetical protein
MSIPWWRSGTIERARVAVVGSVNATIGSVNCRDAGVLRERARVRFDASPCDQDMKRFALLVLALAACGTGRSSERYGFVALLGRDTVSIERVSRRAGTLTSDEVDRFPAVRQRHTQILLAPDGSIRRLAMDIRTPNASTAQGRERHFTADVALDSVRIAVHDSAGTRTRAYATNGALTMAHVPQMYSLIELYFAAALARGAAAGMRMGDSVAVRQFYADREFDGFHLQDGFVRPMADGKVELWHDWLAGIGEATLDSSRRLLTYSGARSTYKVDVHRVAEFPDVETIGARFAAKERNTGGIAQLSVRDTARASIGRATFLVDYGRPLARGRVLLGNVIDYDEVWRTGANAATQFTTSVPITLAGLAVPTGTYTLWTVPHPTGADLIVNRQTGQWGTHYEEEQNLGKAPLRTETLSAPVEKFTISIVAADSGRGSLILEWGTFRWTAPIAVRSR